MPLILDTVGVIRLDITIRPHSDNGTLMSDKAV